MANKMSNLGFLLMTWTMKMFKREKFVRKQLMHVGVKKGDVLLDYACGPGIFAIPAAEIVGKNGKVYAADIHPLAKHYVDRFAKSRGARNIEFILTDCHTGIVPNSVDTALLFDCFHHFKAPLSILKEMHLVLKDDGILAIDIHHTSKEKARSVVLDTKLLLE